MLSARASRELQAVVLAHKAADRDLRSRINRATVDKLNPVWRGELDRRARTDLDRAVIVKGARMRGGNPPSAIAAGSRRRLRGGLRPAEDYAGVEFGANRETTNTYTRRSPKGTAHQVTRRTRRQLPPITRGGRLAYPALAEVAPRAASLWAAIVVKLYADAAEGKRS